MKKNQANQSVFDLHEFDDHSYLSDGIMRRRRSAEKLRSLLLILAVIIGILVLVSAFCAVNGDCIANGGVVFTHQDSAGNYQSCLYK